MIVKTQINLKCRIEKLFFSLLQAGLWGCDIQLHPYMPLDLGSIYELAEEQSVVGIVSAGLEHVTDMKVTKPIALPFMKKVYSLEGRNQAMNTFIGKTVKLLKDEGVFALIVKGQGVAQCYERPLWRSSGDIDFFLDADNYEKAKRVLTPMASDVKEEDRRRLHLAMTMDDWTVELHGTLHTEISKRMNKGIDAIQREIFTQGKVRVWQNGDTDVFLPAPDEDVVLVFTHILEHFFVGGVGLRQLCDWCRLLWTYREQIDVPLLESRLRRMGLMPEWKGFAALAVGYLGMPADAMPLYSDAPKYRRKADRICRLVLQTGNMGHNIDQSYRTKYPGLVAKAITFFRRMGEFARLTVIFPENAVGFWARYVGRRVSAGRIKK